MRPYRKALKLMEKGAEIEFDIGIMVIKDEFLHHVMFKSHKKIPGPDYTKKVYMGADMSVNQFIKLCEKPWRVIKNGNYESA